MPTHEKLSAMKHEPIKTKPIDSVKKSEDKKSSTSIPTTSCHGRKITIKFKR
jgi:hypothetical protein